MNAISQLLSPERIRLDIDVENWAAAVRAAGFLLEEDGLITADYTEDMVTSVADNGPYIVLAPGFALAHARPSAAVLAGALSFVRLREPVAFGHEHNDPVRLVVALAAADDTGHLEAMKQLATVMARPANREALLVARSPEEVLEILTVTGTQTPRPQVAATAVTTPQAGDYPAKGSGDTVESTGKLLTVCGNGLGTSLFLKTTLDSVLDAWGWGGLITVEASDTISARGQAASVDAIVTSQAIAQALGDVDTGVHIVTDFSSPAEADRVLRSIYDVDGGN